MTVSTDEQLIYLGSVQIIDYDGTVMSREAVQEMSAEFNRNMRDPTYQWPTPEHHEIARELREALERNEQRWKEYDQ